MLAYVINKMRKIRISKDMSQMELCLRANMSQSFLANLEAGKKQPSLLSIIRIAKALDVNPREFSRNLLKKIKKTLNMKFMNC